MVAKDLIQNAARYRAWRISIIKGGGTPDFTVFDQNDAPVPQLDSFSDGEITKEKLEVLSSSALKTLLLNRYFDARGRKGEPPLNPERSAKNTSEYETILEYAKTRLGDDIETRLTAEFNDLRNKIDTCLLYTSPSPRDRQKSRMPSSA